MIAAGALLAVVAVVLCFLPLFGLLGYESAAAVGATAGIVVMARTGWILAGPGREGLASAARQQSPTGEYFRLLVGHLGLLLVPLLVLAANALRVKNCDPLMGLQFWLAIPTVSVVMGQTVAWVVSAAGVRRRVWLASTGVLLAEVGWFLYRFAWEPPITGHEWMIGYFSGSIYDEALSLPTSLLWYRALCLVLAASAVLSVELAWRWRSGRPRLPIAAALGACLLAALALHVNRFDLGIAVNHADAVETLGATLETEHFLIHYDPGAIPVRQRPLLAEDHEFHYARHVAWLGVDIVAWRGGRKLESFVYPNRDVQKRLLGSRQTLVARPWTGQMHIRWTAYGEGGVGHEMAHLFSAAFGGGPLRLPVRGVGGLVVNVGLLEGLAEAADWPAEELSAHTASAAMRRLDMAPDLERLLHPAGFWGQPSQRAYTVAGSFVRYLVDTYGIEPFKQVYGDGDFEAAYGRPARDLVVEWEGFIDEWPVSAEDLAVAEYLYRRESIFERVCARTIGERQQQAAQAKQRGEVERAVELWEEIASFEPGSAAHRLSLAEALAEADRYADALHLVEALLEEDLSPARRAAALEQRGDLFWRVGQARVAAMTYREALQEGLPAATVRRLVAKSAGAADERPEVVALAYRYFLDRDITQARGLYSVLRWAELAPDAPLPRYLAGLQLSSLEEWGEAVRSLSLAEPLPHPALAEQRDVTAAQSLLLDRRLDEAEQIYSVLRADPATTPRVRRLAEEGLERVAWRRRHPAPPP